MSFRHRKSSRNEQRLTLSVAGNTGKIYNFYRKLFTVLRRVGNSGTSLLIPTAHKLRCSSIFAKQLLPTWTVKDKSYVWNFPLYSSSSDHTSLWYHSNIIQCRSNGNISSVETLCPNTLSQFHCSKLNRIRNKIRAKAYQNSRQSSSNTKPIRQTKLYDTIYKTKEKTDN